MSKAKIVNEAPSHKYFTQMLNIAEDDLDPFQYRLLAHYVRWSGHGNECDESLRQAASTTKMSVSKVSSSLAELETLNYLKVDRPTQEEARNGKMIHITILDRWADNIQRYQEKSVSKSTHTPVSKIAQAKRKPVSKIAQTPVSKIARLKERGIKEQKQRKRSVFKIKYPSNIRSYTAVHVEAYQKEYDADVTLLIKAWAGEMYGALTEFTTKVAQQYIEVHQEFERLHIPPTDYQAIAAHTRKQNAWKSTISVSDMLLHATGYKTVTPITDNRAAEDKRRHDYEEMFGVK